MKTPLLLRPYLVCLLDKSYPPDHSFVSGMLCDALPSNGGPRTLCVIGRGTAKRRVMRYKRGICLNVLRERRGLGRFLNILIAAALIVRLAARYGKRRVSVLVRNDPFYLLASALIRPFFATWLFQSSFPHEVAEPGWLKRIVTKLIYRACIPWTGGVLVVADAAIKRLRGYSAHVPIEVIPLLDDGDVTCNVSRAGRPASAPALLRLLYVGSHIPSRQLEDVFEACLLANQQGVPLKMVSVGARQQDIVRLLDNPRVQQAVNEGVVRILPRQPRDTLVEHFAAADIGVCAIPPLTIYHEASPTKLAEYFGAGLPVLATTGIPAQVAWLEHSQAGALVDFSPASLADGIRWFWDHRDRVAEMRKNALAFAVAQLRYEAYVPTILGLLQVTSDDYRTPQAGVPARKAA